MKTQVYRKPTHTDQYLHFNSNHPLSVKLGVVQTLHHRAATVTSDPEDLVTEEKHIHQALSRCGYPNWVIRKGSRKHQQNKVQDSKQKDSQQKSAGHATIPYIPTLSEQLKRIFHDHGIQLHFKSNRTVKQVLGNPKDRTAKEKQCGVVYNIKCKECQSEYIGETGRQLKTRLSEHRRPSSSEQDSAVYEHHIKKRHEIDWDNVSILDRDNNTMARKVREALHIWQHTPSMNRDRGYTLSPSYTTVLRKFPPCTSNRCHHH